MLTWHRVQATVSSREIPTLYHQKTNMAVHDSVSSILQHSPTFSNLLQPSSTFFDFLQPSSTFFNLTQPPRMMRCELSAWHCPSHLDGIVSHSIVLYCLLQRCALYHIVLSVCSSDVLSVSHCTDCIVLYCIVSHCCVAYSTARVQWLPWLKQQTQLSDSVLRL